MEPRLGQMFHSSATGRRREQTVPEGSVFVKRFIIEMGSACAPRLSVTIEMSEELASLGRDDSDLDPIRNEVVFRQVTGR